MITFENQQAFEDAVMEVIKKRLQVDAEGDKSYYSKSVDSIDIKLKDAHEDSEFSITYVSLY